MNTKELIKELKEYALVEHVPIMVDEGINFLTRFVASHKIVSVLELGTAIGYSAIMMALTNPNLKITTIERNEVLYLEAVKNIKKFGLEDRITLIYGDALDVNISEKFDMVFIDAAKAQNIKFFEKYSLNLNPNGYILTDNMNFHGLVDCNIEEVKSRNVRGLIRKLREYREFLNNNYEYETIYHDLGDGIAESRRKDS